MAKAQEQDGFFDGVGGKSSKRLGSLLGLAAALLFPFIAGLTNLKVPIAEITTAFLVYSAALQGVSMYQETKLTNGKKK
ncbi:hypothetical protein [Acidithiobacillus sp.]|uniref:hypothetical protein n=1 Tax=Acidithiobacillus sp. TaxID=1872118 RepID=UPI002582D843|nr:hypothetical protein [Acidithiobacillus sp.]MDD5375741.1 hypothetical protein [Acidithiobacillus sp.]